MLVSSLRLVSLLTKSGKLTMALSALLLLLSLTVGWLLASFVSALSNGGPCCWDELFLLIHPVVVVAVWLLFGGKEGRVACVMRCQLFYDDCDV